MSLLKRVHIKDLITPTNLFLAPLAGIGDNAYRVVGRRFGSGLTFSEMISANGIVRGNRKTSDLMQFTDRERPLGIQLFGSDPTTMAEAAGIAAGYAPDLIDINGGCSVRKVLRTRAGAAILADPDHLYRIVHACVNASPVPVSVKIRLGLREDHITVIENALATQEAGAALLTLHPRTAAARYGVSARWEYIARVKEALSIPVCGNGDIREAGDAVRMILETGCDAVMVGRGAIGNPWLLEDIIRSFEAYPEEIETAVPSVDERVRLTLEHLEIAIGFKGEQRAVSDMKRHMHRYVRGMRDAASVRERLFRAHSAEEVRAQLQSLVR